MNEKNLLFLFTINHQYVFSVPEAPDRTDKSAEKTLQISERRASTSGSHLHFSGTHGALPQSFHLFSCQLIQEFPFY